MGCNLWIEKALPYLDGALNARQARAYAAHLEGCERCRAEVESSASLIRAFRRLSDPAMTRQAAARFDAAVLSRITVRPSFETAAVVATASAVAESPVAARLDNPFDSRARAAQVIAARSRQAGRPVFAQLSPLPSLTLASLGLAAASIITALLFGGWIIRGLGMSFGVAFAALANGGVWLVERLGIKVVELVTVGRILGRAISDLGPWGEAMRQLLGERGYEITIAFVLAVALAALAGLLHLRRKARAISRY